MKRIFTLLVLLTVIVTGWAQKVEIDGIAYNLNNESKTAEVTSKSPKYLDDVVIPASVTYGDVEYSVTSIGSIAFYQCSGLTSVTIPSSVTSIGINAFSGCSGLTSVTIPNSVTSIETSAFSGCSGLPVIDGFRYADTYLVELVDKSLTDVKIKEGTRFIGYKAFYQCSGLTSVTIPNSVQSIGDYAFYYCRGLTSVSIPNSVTSIGDHAFYECI